MQTSQLTFSQTSQPTVAPGPGEVVETPLVPLAASFACTRCETGVSVKAGPCIDCRAGLRRLASLQPMIEAYVRRVWYLHPRAKSFHGADPNAPREPGYYGRSVRLAARTVDVMLGGNVRLIGRCTCPPCDCPIATYPNGDIMACPHVAACPHTGGDETQKQASNRLRALLADREVLRSTFRPDADGVYRSVYRYAGLTDGESDVARYQHEGLSHSSIAFITDRNVGTVKALLARAHFKLRALADESEVLEVSA